jgi:tryptophanyl-tRNA synthetase
MDGVRSNVIYHRVLNVMSERLEKPRILSGMRPTGKLHLGNYMGALRNWVRLQNESEDGRAKYDGFFCVVDYHALTTDYADPSQLRQNTLDVALDWLAAGLDPAKSTMFVQSHVPQHAELHLLLSMITPLGWLERVPSYKEQQENITGKDLHTYGFLGYPLLQAADILLYRPKYVPVGADQVAHVELTREIARRFNFLYASEASPVFPEPEVLLTPSPKLPGTDGRKMSKSYGNTILMSEPEVEIRARLKTMVTDPARIKRSDPGNPEICPVGDLHKVFSSPETIAKVWEGCQTAGIGCIECKGWLADAVVKELAPMRERRAEFEAKPALVHEILDAGAVKAGAAAAHTLTMAQSAAGMLLRDPGSALEADAEALREEIS